MGARGIPDYFGLARYGIGPRGVAHQVLGCDPERIRPLAVLAPAWSPQMLADHVDHIDPVSDGLIKVDDVACDGFSFSYVLCTQRGRRASSWGRGAGVGLHRLLAHSICWLGRGIGRERTGGKAAALLQVSDVIPARKSLFSGRTPSERERRQEVP